MERRKKKIQYECCGRVFKTLGWFKVHTKSHKVDKFCDICDKSFANAEKLQGHIKKKHTKSDNKDVKVRCSFCNVLFKKAKLKRHIVIHTGERNYKCDVCQRDFNRHDHLRKHAMTHRPNSERLFKCPHCNKGFIEKGVLRRHENTHKGFKPYKCGVCSRCFYTDTALKQHMQCHTDLKLFLCNECGKSFRRKGTLQCHISVVHGKERLYECTVCNKGFGTNDGLTRHARIHSGEMPYKCLKCGRQFARVDVYNYHINRKTDCTKDKTKKNGAEIKTEIKTEPNDTESNIKTEANDVETNIKIEPPDS